MWFTFHLDYENSENRANGFFSKRFNIRNENSRGPEQMFNINLLVYFKYLLQIREISNTI